MTNSWTDLQDRSSQTQKHASHNDQDLLPFLRLKPLPRQKQEVLERELQKLPPPPDQKNPLANRLALRSPEPNTASAALRIDRTPPPSLPLFHILNKPSLLFSPPFLNIKDVQIYNKTTPINPILTRKKTKVIPRIKSTRHLFIPVPG